MKKYTIKKGRNYSGYRFRPILFPRSVSFEFMFTEESKYQSEPNTQLREQINKLAGLSFDPFGVNSWLKGWRYDSALNTFFICDYRHIGGRAETITEVKNTEIAKVGQIRICTVTGTGGFIGYRQYPYFGGKAAAPTSISIHLKFI